MKAIWRGTLTFGLVNIDIELLSAIKEHVVSFNLLHDTCRKQIHNLRWCDHCDKEVTWDHVVKGLKVSKNKFIVLTKEALKKLKPLRTDTINIETFIDADKLQPLWFDAHYYALERKDSDRAYALFVAALEKSNKIGIGRLVMKEKEHVCAIQTYQHQLLITTLHYPHEIRPLPKKQRAQRFDHDELQLANYLIEKMSHKKISPALFRDTFVEKLKKILTSKSKTAALKVVPLPKPHKEITLRESLEKSLKTQTKRRRA